MAHATSQTPLRMVLGPIDRTAPCHVEALRRARVAVFSTVGRIRKALEESEARQGIVSPVTYVPIPSRRRMEDISQQYGLMHPENLSRPYLYKDSGFRIEEEVRFIVATHPNPTDVFEGAVINVDAQAIISDFEISRELPSEEKQSISLIADRRLNTLPDFEPGFSDGLILTPFKTFSTEPDLPPGLFPDIDGCFHT
jgi:hypothetical protein